MKKGLNNKSRYKNEIEVEDKNNNNNSSNNNNE